MNTVGEIIARYRKNLGITQLQFSEIMGVARSTIASMEMCPEVLEEFKK